MVHKVAAHGDIILSLSLDRQKLESEARGLCKRLVKGWAELDSNQIQVLRIFKTRLPVRDKSARLKLLRLNTMRQVFEYCRCQKSQGASPICYGSSVRQKESL